MLRILLTEPLDADAEARLAAGAALVRPAAGSGPPAEAALCDLVADCDGLVMRTSARVTRAVLAAGRRLRVVGVAGVGTDCVDVAAARELGIAVLNTPGAATEAVADLTVALMLQLLRPIPRLAEAYRRGQFAAARAAPHGRELAECTIGIIGMGRIGTAVARRCAAGFGARVLYNDIVSVGPFEFADPGVLLAPADKATIWRGCDIISLHVPLTDPGPAIPPAHATRRLIDADVLGQFRPGAFLINTARGGVIDTAALSAALGASPAGRLGGAALDVTDPEPLPADHPLFKCERCILTPHVAARTHHGLRRMYAVVDDVLAFLAGAR
ncbi:MAG: NAD(P)-dependent oxidoreductase [Planctomycetota bacterium]